MPCAPLPPYERERLRSLMQCEILDTEPDLELEYLEFADLEEFRIVNDFSSEGQYALCIAAFIGGVRLIDNKIFTVGI